jgi:hypothetical protein
MNVLANLAGFSLLLLTPYYLVNTLGLSPLASGSRAWRCRLPAAWPVRRWPPGWCRGSGGGGRRSPASPSSASGCCRSALTDGSTPLWVVALLLVAEGVGQGLLSVAYIDLVTDTLPPRDRGVAGSLSQLTRTLGIVSGASVLTALHAHGAADGGFLGGYRFAFLAAGGGLLGAWR